MKKVVLTAATALLGLSAFAQTNLQVFYDFEREHVTSTLEMFKSDDWGSTFFFVDYDYTTKNQRDYDNFGATGSYFEMSRSLNFWQDSNLGALSAHVEFNGGVGFGNRNWLFGAEYFLHSADFANTLTLELMYKTFKGSKSDLPLQFTAVWGMKNIFGVEGLNFSGFADFWGEKVYAFRETGEKFNKESNFVFISEPQLWYNVGSLFDCPNLNVGAEIELSANFAGNDGFKFRPCLGIKWDF